MSLLASVAVARFRFRFRASYLIMLLIVQMIPGQALIIALFLDFNRVNLLQSLLGLVIVYTAQALPVSIWMLRNFVATVPRELDEAAAVDGAGPLRIFWRIMFPLVMPGLIATSVFSFITAYNEFIVALTFLGQARSDYTLPIYVTYFFGRGGAEWGPIMAASTLYTIPVVVFFLLVQRRMTSGPGRRGGEGMSAGLSTDPALARLADAVLIPPFPGHRAPGWVLAALDRGLAGVTLFGPNIEGPEQLAALTAQLRGAGPQPLVALDEEGGDVTRIAHLTGSPYPGNAALGAVDDVALTAAVHQALGQDLAALGVTVDLAPSVDVNTAADNPVIGIRSFGSDPDLVARHAAAAVSGLQAAGVAACAKHFPGHGSTSADTHRELVTVDASLDLLRHRDLPPFIAAIAAGVRGVMPGHLRVPELTGDLPATLSPAALTGLLRGELGFTGVIISDALEMRAVSDAYGIPEAAVRAVAAGTDLLCLGRDLSEDGYLAVRRALSEAVSSGRLPARRLEEAERNVAQLRAWLAAAGPGGTAASGGGAAENAHIGLTAR